MATWQNNLPLGVVPDQMGKRARRFLLGGFDVRELDPEFIGSSLVAVAKVKKIALHDRSTRLSEGVPAEPVLRRRCDCIEKVGESSQVGWRKCFASRRLLGTPFAAHWSALAHIERPWWACCRATPMKCAMPPNI